MSKDQIELYKDLCARVPYDTYVQITDPSTQRIEKLDLLTLLEFQEDDPPRVYKPFYKKLSDLSNDELIDLARIGKVGDSGKIASTCDFIQIKGAIVVSDWRIQLDVRYIFGQNITHPAEEFNCVRNYDFMEMTAALFDYAMSHHLDIRSFIDRNLAIRVTSDNNPYNHEQGKKY